jgi:hypothetical protein
MLSKGFTLKDAANTVPLFEDNNQVVVDSGPGVMKYQEANVFKIEKQEPKDTEDTEEEKRPFPDLSDQEDNSPNIGSMRTGDKEDV